MMKGRGRKIREAVLGTTLGWGICYLLGSGYVEIDYATHHEQELISDPPPSEQDIRSFRTDDGRLLTILGEVHIYNRLESERAQDLVPQYDLLVTEGNDPHIDEVPAYIRIAALVATPSRSSYRMGSGRRGYPDSTAYASDARVPIEYLETGDDSYWHRASGTRQALLVGSLVLEGLTAPIAYFEGKTEAEEARHGIVRYDVDSITRYATNLDERNRIMAHNLTEVLRTTDARRVLCVVGRAHVDGLVHELEARMHLEKAKNPQF